jgi:heme A synthase
MLDSQAAATISVDQKLSRRARAQLVMLIAQFLLGMGVNLIGQPTETTGAAKAVTTAALAGHVAIAAGLIVGAILTVRRAAAVGAELRTQSRIGVALVAITIAAGVLTMTLRSNWWSYLMAVGFVALLLVYGNLYRRAKDR